MRQILLYALSNLFDSINLIKLIWPCISGLIQDLCLKLLEFHLENKWFQLLHYCCHFNHAVNLDLEPEQLNHYIARC